VSLMCAVGGIGQNKEVEVGSFTCIENSRPAGASYVLQLVNQRYPKQPKVPIWTSPGLRGSKTGLRRTLEGTGNVLQIGRLPYLRYLSASAIKLRYGHCE